MHLLKFLIVFPVIIKTCASYKILAVFPFNGRSHHICFSSLVEELASRDHDVTVINYFPVKKMPNLKQISLQEDSDFDNLDIEDHQNKLSRKIFGDFFKAYESTEEFEYVAKSNCKKLVHNEEVQKIMNSNTKYDVVIVEQFVSDCHLALAHRLQAPMVGIAAHVLMPWTYARLGAPNHPAFVPNHFFSSGSKPDLWNRFKNFAINTYLIYYYQYIIQKTDHEIVKAVYPDTPDLETLGRIISLILLNQYFPLTGSRLYGSNVIEVGGLHTSRAVQLDDEALSSYLNNSKNGVVYISFGSVSKNIPRKVVGEIMKVIQKSDLNFLWKVDDVSLSVPKNVLLRKWVAQPAVLCHPNVKAFVTHSGMLSSTEAMHCGVPVVGVPLFGDQFANAASAEEAGLGVQVDISNLDEKVLTEALDTVLHERYQRRAKELSDQWRDRPQSAMDTAIHWVEYVAKHPHAKLKPPTVDLPLYQYLMLDILGIAIGILTFVLYLFKKIIGFMSEIVGVRSKQNVPGKKKKQ